MRVRLTETECMEEDKERKLVVSGRLAPSHSQTRPAIDQAVEYITPSNPQSEEISPTFLPILDLRLLLLILSHDSLDVP